MDARPSGVVATQIPATSATTRHATVTPTDHHRIRYKAAGRDTVRNRTTSRHAGSCAPAMRVRALPRRTERREMSTGSGATDRTVDRCVATAW